MSRLKNKMRFLVIENEKSSSFHAWQTTDYEGQGAKKSATLWPFAFLLILHIFSFTRAAKSLAKRRRNFNAKDRSQPGGNKRPIPGHMGRSHRSIDNLKAFDKMLHRRGRRKALRVGLKATRAGHWRHELDSLTAGLRAGDKGIERDDKKSPTRHAKSLEDWET